jgi:hypothetical protein
VKYYIFSSRQDFPGIISGSPAQRRPAGLSFSLSFFRGQMKNVVGALEVALKVTLSTAWKKECDDCSEES